jgi:hypothetical protein
MKRRYVMPVALLFVAFNVFAQTPGESFAVTAPDYWNGSQVIFHKDTGGGGSALGRIPKDQSKESYEEALWEQRYPKTGAIHLPLAGLIENTLENYWHKCEHVRNTAPKTKNENGYEVAFVQITCNRLKAEPGKGIIARAKFIRTANGHYSVAHEFILNSFDKDDGANFSTLPIREEKFDRFKRYLASFPQLDQNSKICDATSRCQ